MSALSQRGEAWKLTYGPKWKCGQSPQSVKLGELTFPVEAGIEEMEQSLRFAFPTATDCRLFKDGGKSFFFCSSNLS